MGKILRLAVLLTLAVSQFGLPALAISGQVHNEAGKPLENAKACLLLIGIELLCDATGPQGFYRLPESQVDKVRITAPGYLPIEVAAADLEKPVVMSPAESWAGVTQAGPTVSVMWMISLAAPVARLRFRSVVPEVLVTRPDQLPTARERPLLIPARACR